MTDAHYAQLLRQNREQAEQIAQLKRDRESLENEAGEYRRRLDSLRRQVHELANERDRFAAGLPLVCSDERHAAKVRGLEAQLAELQNEDASDWFSRALFARKVTALWDAPTLSAAFTGDKPEPPDQAEPVTLTARYLSYPRPVCTGCEWAAHPPLTCDEVAAFRDRFDSLLAEGLKEIRDEDRPVCAHPVSQLGMDPVTSATVCQCGQWITPPAFPRQDRP